MNLPLFPLQSVFFPGEMVPLHIFEDRYKQLIRDCKEGGLSFGIPVYINNTLQYGTEMELLEIVDTYPNGEMDIICRAVRVFQVKTFNGKLLGYPYAGGTVEFREYLEDADPIQRQAVMEAIKELYRLMEISWDHVFKYHQGFHQWVHNIGLNLQQEYELLQMKRESERLGYVGSHLRVAIEVLGQLSNMKDMIELNGHFKNFDPLNFKDFKI
jgi:hypothetical protein